MPPVFDTPLFTGDQSIERVLHAGLPVMLVFVDGALQPELDREIKQLAKTQAGRLLVAQVTRKDNPETARRFGIQSVPAVATAKDGKLYSKLDGADSSALLEHARYVLGEGPRPDERQQVQARPTTAPSTNGSPDTGTPVIVTDATFEQEVLHSPVPVLVDFWAPWCGPCRMVAPILEKLAREMQGRLKIAKVNVDEHSRFAGRYGVQAIPTMLLVRNGQVVDQWAGALPEPALRSRLARAL